MESQKKSWNYQQISLLVASTDNMYLHEINVLFVCWQIYMKAQGGHGEDGAPRFHDLSTRTRLNGQNHALITFYSKQRPDTQFDRRLSKPWGHSGSLNNEKNLATTWDLTWIIAVHNQLFYVNIWKWNYTWLSLHFKLKLVSKYGSVYERYQCNNCWKLAKYNTL